VETGVTKKLRMNREHLKVVLRKERKGLMQNIITLRASLLLSTLCGYKRLFQQTPESKTNLIT